METLHTLALKKGTNTEAFFIPFNGILQEYASYWMRTMQYRKEIWYGLMIACFAITKNKDQQYILTIYFTERQTTKPIFYISKLINLQNTFFLQIFI